MAAYFLSGLPAKRHLGKERIVVVAAPASCSRNTAMICSSVNLDLRIVRLLWSDGLYPNLEEIAGLRSDPIASRYFRKNMRERGVRSKETSAGVMFLDHQLKAANDNQADGWTAYGSEMVNTTGAIPSLDEWRDWPEERKEGWRHQ